MIEEFMLPRSCPICGSRYGEDQMFCPRDGAALRRESGSADLVGTVVADRFRVLRKLGEGGMGQVYLAEQVKMRRRCALKVMHPATAQDTASVNRFWREATNASRIEHPNVATVYDFGETHEGLVFLAMEYIEGETLAQLLAREGPLRPARVAALVEQVAAALTAAHALGIVHRDLKPDNIMVVAVPDGTERVKVVDFGIAKAMQDQGQNVTTTGHVIGTPLFMSPEQIAAAPVDGRSDEYSLAITAYRMLTGEYPFRGKTPNELITARLIEGPRPLVDSAPHVQWAPDLEAVLQRGLATKAEERFPTTVEFATSFSAAARCQLETTVPEHWQPDTLILEPDKPKAAAPRAEDAPRPPRASPAGTRTVGRLVFAVAAIVIAGGLSWLGWPARPSRGTAADAERVVGAVTALGATPQPGPTPVSGDDATRPQHRADPGPQVPVQRALSSGPRPGTRDTVVERAPSVVDARKPGPPDPPTASPVPAVLDARQAINQLRTLTRADDDQANERAVRESAGLLGRMSDRADSVLVLYYRARAHANLGQQEAACSTLATASRLATGLSLAGDLTQTRETLGCP